MDKKFRQIVLWIEQITKEDKEAEKELGFQDRLEETPISSAKIEETIKKLEERLEQDPKNKPLKKAKRQLEKDLLPRKQKYELQKQTFGERKSFSKTDNDATFMRMKDDHMMNGQLKPGYKVQIGIENQFITNFSLHQRAGDPGCMFPHLELLEKHNRQKPKAIIADSGYGSEENYAHCEEHEIEAYIKYNTFVRNRRRHGRNKLAVLKVWSMMKSWMNGFVQTENA